MDDLDQDMIGRGAALDVSVGVVRRVLRIELDAGHSALGAAAAQKGRGSLGVGRVLASVDGVGNVGEQHRRVVARVDVFRQRHHRLAERERQLPLLAVPRRWH